MKADYLNIYTKDRIERWEKNIGKPIDEIVAVARQNLEEVGFTQRNVEFLLKYALIEAYDKYHWDYVKEWIENNDEDQAAIYLTTD